MLTPAAKRRRRAEAASATLSRPFRSPSIRRDGALGVNSPKVTPGTKDEEARRVTAPVASHSTTSAKDEPPSAAVSPERIHKRRRPPSRLKEGTEPLKKEFPISLDSLLDQFSLDLDAGDKVIVDARTSTSPQEKQTASRAKKKTDNDYGKDSNKELRELIVRWKEAGRLAADELFSIISERVTAVGGVRAWRAMSLSQAQEDSISSQKNAGRRRKGQDDDGSGDEDNQNEVEDEDEVDDGDKEENDDKAEESQDFTMATMLASMGVDLDLLGYDETEEGWK